MKSPYINLKSLAINAILCLALAFPSTAQHTDGGNTRPASPPPANSGGSAPRSFNGGSAPTNGGVQRQSFNGGGAPNNSAVQRQSFNGGGAPANGGVQRQSFNGGAAPNNGGVQRPSFNGGARVNTVPRTYNSNGQPGNNQGAPRPYIGPRQGMAPGQRGVSSSAQIGISGSMRPGYHSYTGLSGGVTRIGGTERRPSGGYYNAHGYYNSFYAPHLGFRLNILPRGYYPFYWGPNQYFYNDGLYYQYLNDEYEVVEPPVGAAINTLPDNAQPIMINGIQYYELNGVYYQPVTKDDGSVVYQVAGKDGELNTDSNGDAPGDMAPPQIGDMVATLPQGCRTLRINGQKYYVSPDDYYYQDARDNNNNKVYKIVGTPSDEPNQ